MDPESIIGLLEPLREPNPIDWWPLAPGWWILATVTLALVVYGLYRAWLFHRRAAPIRAARQAFAKLEAAKLSDAQSAAQLGVLHRRLAIGVAGRRASAGLTGAAWAEFLNSLTKSQEPHFDATLVEFAYQAQVKHQDCQDALQATRLWLGDLKRP